MNETTQKRQGNFLTRLVRKQIFIPLAALLLLIVFNLIADPSFFAITLKENSLGDLVLTGNLITILDNASELVILAIGMTLVTAASGGQDISVGSAIAIAGSVVLRVLCAVWRALAQKRKAYLTKEARNLVDVHSQKEADREQ